MHYSSPSGPVDFNPLHHEGGDYEHLLEDRKADAISIHSTTRVETDVSQFALQYADISIHSTTRVETSLCNCFVLFGNNFNPLHHEGGDI